MPTPTVSDIAVAVSAIVAAFSLVLFVIQDRRTRREREIREWQTAIIYRLFIKRFRDPLPISDILSSYRSEAIAKEIGSVPRSELSEHSLLRILTEMCARRLIEPAEMDTFRLFGSQDAPMPDELGGMMNALQQFLGNAKVPGDVLDIKSLLKDTVDQEMSIYHRAINIVADEPNRYSVSDLVLRLAKELNVEHERVRSKLLAMVRNGNLSEEDGRLYL